MILNPQQYLTKHWKDGHLKSLLFDKPVKPKPHYVVHKGIKLTPEEYERTTDVRAQIIECLTEKPMSAKELAYETGFADKTVYTYLANMVTEGVLVKKRPVYELV